MPQEVNLLDQVRFASPCGVPWEAMTGDDRARVCGKCQRNVYNLTGMIPLEAEQFLIARQGPDCNRVYRRVDGSVITRDCPRGIRRARLSVVAVIGVAALFLFAAEQYGNYVRISNTETYDITSLEPFARFRPTPSTAYGAIPGNAPYVFGQQPGPRFSRHGSFLSLPYSSGTYQSLGSASSSTLRYSCPQFSMKQRLAMQVKQLSQQYPGSYGPAPAVASQPSNEELGWQAFKDAMKLLKLRAWGSSSIEPDPQTVAAQFSPATSQPWHPGDNLIP